MGDRSGVDHTGMQPAMQANSAFCP